MADSSLRGRRHIPMEELIVKMQSQSLQKELGKTSLKNKLQSVTENMAKLKTESNEKDVVIKRKSKDIVDLEKELKKKVLEIEKLKREKCRLQEENRKLLNDLIECKICYKSESSAILLPCRHFSLCKTCSLKCSHCPFCRTKIVDRIYTFSC